MSKVIAEMNHRDRAERGLKTEWENHSFPVIDIPTGNEQRLQVKIKRNEKVTRGKIKLCLDPLCFKFKFKIKKAGLKWEGQIYARPSLMIAAMVESRIANKRLVLSSPKKEKLIRIETYTIKDGIVVPIKIGDNTLKQIMDDIFGKDVDLQPNLSDTPPSDSNGNTTQTTGVKENGQEDSEQFAQGKANHEADSSQSDETGRIGSPSQTEREKATEESDS